ncbi:unnamed protein product [Prorocentrum cordatum]|uniref:Uncharacterized protein n=1 Tax=Prorocentrum cordatum TaxID=2364126 RepID=A0ABN9VAV8_9DINO|nr:unnamed protein product [Polarella glacialis]
MLSVPRLCPAQSQSLVHTLRDVELHGMGGWFWADGAARDGRGVLCPAHSHRSVHTRCSWKASFPLLCYAALGLSSSSENIQELPTTPCARTLLHNTTPLDYTSYDEADEQEVMIAIRSTHSKVHDIPDISSSRHEGREMRQNIENLL